ncbi:MAG: hypothetical protein K2I77_06865 [Anaeroplasmataceae bacterium]|nr:hypothetical protein [Anaeroplasmataceae bacterium]
MRINPKLFTVTDGADAFEVQEFDGRKVELFMMDAYPKVKDEFINKGKFAVWSSMDGRNYRVFIENGYYEELKALYTPAVNKIWVDFWDVCEKISRKTSYCIILPITAVAVALCIGFNFLLPNDVSFFAMLAIVVVAFVAMLFLNRLTKKKIYDANVSSVEEIKKCVGGAKNFDELIDKQKNYMDSYYDALYPEDEEFEDEEESLKEDKVAEEPEVLEAPKEENQEVKDLETEEPVTTEDVKVGNDE